MRDEMNKAAAVLTGSRIDECAARERASQALRREAENLRRRAHDLEALAYQTERLTPEADEALWSLVVGLRR